MGELTLQPVRRLFKRAGAKRISDRAAEELAGHMEREAKRILIKAKELAEHAGRRTVLRRDIKMAKKMVEGSGSN